MDSVFKNKDILGLILSYVPRTYGLVNKQWNKIIQSKFPICGGCGRLDCFQYGRIKLTTYNAKKRPRICACCDCKYMSKHCIGCKHVDSPNNLRTTLDKIKLTPDVILIVNTKNGVERKALHVWAEGRGMQHISIKTSKFTGTLQYYCPKCDVSYYANELDTSHDWGRPKSRFGHYVKCKKCGSIHDNPSDDEYYGYKGYKESDIDVPVKTFNGVLMAISLPLLNKRETRRYRNKNISDNDDSILDQMEYNNYWLGSKEKFGTTFYKGIKEYTRNRSYNI